jgi:hypothetical protein
LTVKNGKPAFPKPSKELVDARQRQLACERALTACGKAHPDYENISNALESASNALWEEIGRRLALLIGHYKINDRGEKMPLMLALALATDFVENFDVFATPPKAGRPRSRGEEFGLSFVVAVETKMRDRGTGIADACFQLSKKGQPWDKFGPRTLETRYYEAKARLKKLDNALQRIFAEELPKPEG